eukprot:TRINITY_DN13190_c0_g2_i1.p1 TRINITY_DN13190_c0_g2~~TRINITY_DN13190_c0_g2_i1.p1  ORF type:complete len:263 (+),score=8.87 TRINITY_DN13190_c0_g2_i1:35-790(+)
MVSRMPIGTPSDLFSVGCTLYFMFRRKPPFRSTPHSDDVVHGKTTRCKFQFDVYFDDVSEACKNLISSLIVREPAERLSSEQALQHEWLTSRAALSSHTSEVSGATASDEQVATPRLLDCAMATADRPRRPAAFESESSVQSSQRQTRNTSETEEIRTPPSRPAPSSVPSTLEPRRPSRNPVAFIRSFARRHTDESRPSPSSVPSRLEPRRPSENPVSPVRSFSRRHTDESLAYQYQQHNEFSGDRSVRSR